MTINVSTDHLHIDEAICSRGVATLPTEDSALLERVRQSLQLAADVSRSDVLLLFTETADRICVAVHAQPHSMASLYQEPLAGRCYDAAERRWLWNAMKLGLRRKHTTPEIPDQFPEVEQQVWPVLNAQKRPLAAVAFYTNAIECERHKRRERAYQRALSHFQQMVSVGQLTGAETLPPFGEADGIVFVDHQSCYRYLSGQASNVYRRLGYLDDLRSRSLAEVASGDLELVHAAWLSRRCVESEDEVRGHILLRRVIPLFGKVDADRWQRHRAPDQFADVYGALLLVSDLTETREKAKELKVKAVMIKEVHHRVKNNLQMLVSIMRMQARRAQTEEARMLLYEAINRILSMAVIHQSLSEGEDQVLNLRDVVSRIAGQVQQGIGSPGRSIHIAIVQADNVYLPTNKATACALVVNELLLNALEHAFSDRERGHIWISLLATDDQVELRVADDGRGLPESFSLTSESSLGLDIVRTLVQDDLKGHFELISRPEAGAQAVVHFPRSATGGKS